MSTSEVLSSAVAAALHRNPIPVLRVLRVEETEQEVVLSGSVSSYYLKQLAQEAVLPLLSGRRLHNRVNVVRERV
jgi:hypothetical protein